MEQAEPMNLEVIYHRKDQKEPNNREGSKENGLRVLSKEASWTIPMKAIIKEVLKGKRVLKDPSPLKDGNSSKKALKEKVKDDSKTDLKYKTSRICLSPEKDL